MSIVDRFRPELSAVLLDAINYARSHVSEIPMRHREQWKVVRVNGERALGRRQMVSADYSFFLGNRRSDIQEMPSFKKLFATIRTDTEITRSLRLESNSADEFLNSYFISIATSILEREDANKDREQAETSVLTQFDEFLMKDTYTARVCAALLNFNSDIVDVELADGIFLRPVSDPALESYINSISPMMGFVAVRSLLAINFQLEGVMEQERTGAQPMAMGAQFQNKSEDLLKAFRIIKPGAIGYSFTAGEVVDPLGFGGTWMTLPGSETIFGQGYEFAQTDIRQFKDVLKNLRTLE